MLCGATFVRLLSERYCLHLLVTCLIVVKMVVFMPKVSSKMFLNTQINLFDFLHGRMDSQCISCRVVAGSLILLKSSCSIFCNCISLTRW